MILTHRFGKQVLSRKYVTNLATYNSLLKTSTTLPQDYKKVFSKYFTKNLAEEYERQPERIANRVYANRMGNGDEQSGDGWKYRGRGLIQLTGKTNYMLFTMEADNEALIKPNAVSEPDLACESAAWFWNRNDLNSFADKQDVRGMTRRINGGFNGLQDRQIKYNKVLATLK